jgi:hypothetical protein
MPEIKQLRVVVGSFGKAGVMTGDLLTLKGDDHVVETKKSKQAYEYYTFTDGTKGRLPLDSEVNISRNEPTLEEAAAETLTAFARKMRRMHDESIKAVDSGVELIHSQFKAARDKGN